MTVTAGSVHVEADIPRRTVRDDCLHHEGVVKELTGGLGTSWVKAAVEHMYTSLDLIDYQLIQNGSEPISQLVELANLSSMIGNLLGAGLAIHSDGTYVRNAPHTYPDLVSQRAGVEGLEIKMALETNKPKGHLPKEGLHITFRYVLCASDGTYTVGKQFRGAVPWIWEVRIGDLREADYSISNTAGDSGKTAVIKTDSLARMHRVLYVPELLPYGRRQSLWGDLG